MFLWRMYQLPDVNPLTRTDMNLFGQEVRGGEIIRPTIGNAFEI